MTTGTAIWLAINSVVVLFLAAIVFVTVRQVGILLNQLGPIGARDSNDGPRIGENIGSHVATLPDLDSLAPKPTLVVFGSLTCSVCAAVREGAEKLTRYWGREARIVMVYDDDAAPNGDEALWVERGLVIRFDSKLRDRLDVTLVPFAVMMDARGEVLGKGLVNEISHLESLLELTREESARETSLRVVSG